MAEPGNITDASVKITLVYPLAEDTPNRQSAALAVDAIMLVAALKMKRLDLFQPKQGLKFDIYLKDGMVIDGLTLDDTIDGEMLVGSEIERIQIFLSVEGKFEIHSKTIHKGGTVVVNAFSKEIPI